MDSSLEDSFDDAMDCSFADADDTLNRGYREADLSHDADYSFGGDNPFNDSWDDSFHEDDSFDDSFNRGFQEIEDSQYYSDFCSEDEMDDADISGPFRPALNCTFDDSYMGEDSSFEESFGNRGFREMSYDSGCWSECDTTG